MSNSVARATLLPAILYDKFHVLRQLNEAMDKVCKQAYARVAGADRRFIKGQSSPLLAHGGTLTTEGKKALQLLFQVNTAPRAVPEVRRHG